jgi:hypothetical protein
VRHSEERLEASVQALAKQGAEQVRAAQETTERALTGAKEASKFALLKVSMEVGSTPQLILCSRGCVSSLCDLAML